MLFSEAVEAPIPVTSHHGNYAVIVKCGLISQPDAYKPYVHGKQVIIVTHQSLEAPYLKTLTNTLKTAAARTIETIYIPEGDEHKTLSACEQIWQTAIQLQYRRDCIFVALGGGMIGDLTGFAASCYLRGVDCLQIPTTLLAQVDSSVGGKTGVNHALGKNLIGSFFSPKAVMIDPEVLNSLPQREFNAGLAEIVKYGISLDAEFFEWLEQEGPYLRGNSKKCIQAIYHSCKLKADVVKQDEFESHHRMLLNFGHTLGHAIETAMEYQGILHGEAVAIGMVFATFMSCESNLVAYNVLSRLIDLLKSIGLPTNFPHQIAVDTVLDKIQQDKKFKQKMQWVLLKAPGQAFVSNQISHEQLRDNLYHWAQEK